MSLPGKEIIAVDIAVAVAVIVVVAGDRSEAGLPVVEVVVVDVGVFVEVGVEVLEDMCDDAIADRVVLDVPEEADPQASLALPQTGPAAPSRLSIGAAAGACEKCGLGSIRLLDRPLARYGQTRIAPCLALVGPLEPHQQRGERNLI